MYARDLDGKTLTLGVSGKLIRNSLVMFDRETDTLWSHLTGEALEGTPGGAPAAADSIRADDVGPLARCASANADAQGRPQ